MTFASVDSFELGTTLNASEFVAGIFNNNSQTLALDATTISAPSGLPQLQQGLGNGIS